MNLSEATPVPSTWIRLTLSHQTLAYVFHREIMHVGEGTKEATRSSFKYSHEQFGIGQIKQCQCGKISHLA